MPVPVQPDPWWPGPCRDWAAVAARHGHIPSAALHGQPSTTALQSTAELPRTLPSHSPTLQTLLFDKPLTLRPVAFTKTTYAWLELPAPPPGAAAAKVCPGPARTHGVTTWATLRITVALEPSHSAGFSGGSGDLHPLSCSQQELSLETSTVSALRINSSQQHQRNFINCLLCSEQENTSCFNKPLLRDFFPKTSLICTPRLFYQLVKSRNKTCMTNREAISPDTLSVQVQFKVEITSEKQRNLHSLSVLIPLMLII